VLFFGDLLGRAEEAKQWVADYEARIAAAKAKVDAAVPADAAFTIFEWSDKALSMYGEDMGRGGVPIYRNLGRPMPDSNVEVLKEEDGYLQISLEVLEDFAGDYILLTTEKSLEEIENDPIWSKLDAVQNGRVYVWRNERSYFNDPLSVLSQTEELANWLAGTK
jgi:iron complex transport system substrate-binding protein